jgi:hypothetical protein
LAACGGVGFSCRLVKFEGRVRPCSMLDKAICRM